MKNTIPVSLSQLLVVLLLIAPIKQFAQFGSSVASIRPTVDMIIINSGDFNSIKEAKLFNLEFDYSKMKVGFYKTEEEYVNRKVKENNDKEPGKGELWKSGWLAARKKRYEPAFEKYFNKTVAKKLLVIKQGADSAKYTLIVRTIFTESGINYGFGRQTSYVSFKYDFYEKGNATPLLSLIQDNVSGANSGAYDADSRIAGSYALAGKILGKYFLREFKKTK